MVPLPQFSDNTENDRKRANDLFRRFIKPGPDPANGKLPYSEVLQGAVAKLRKEAAEAGEAYKKNLDEWEHSTIVAATAVTYSMCTRQVLVLIRV